MLLFCVVCCWHSCGWVMFCCASVAYVLGCCSLLVSALYRAFAMCANLSISSMDSEQHALNTCDHCCCAYFKAGANRGTAGVRQHLLLLLCRMHAGLPSSAFEHKRRPVISTIAHVHDVCAGTHAMLMWWFAAGLVFNGGLLSAGEQELLHGD